MSRDIRRIEQEIGILRVGYTITVGDNYEYLIFHDLRTPPGYNYVEIPVAIRLASDYPLTPTIFEHGGYGLNTVPGLLFKGRRLDRYYYFPVQQGYWYWCFRELQWDPYRDNLNVLLELFRATMADPPLV